MMKLIVVGAAVMAGALGAFGASDAELAKLVAEDLSRPVRPGGVGGQEFWNANAQGFVYPPAFDFPAVEGAEKYQFRVIDSAGKVHEFTDANPKASLVKVWGELPDGMNVLWWEASGWGPLRQASRVFWKMAPYRPGSYPKPPYGYGEAARRGYGYVLDLKFMRTLAETGRPDPDYKLNCYPAKMGAALITGMIRCAKALPERREEALRLARAAADHLISIAQPAGAPLAHFPPTYEGTYATAKEYAGMHMLIYPAQAALAHLSLYDATKERKYLDAALGIAATYLRLQGEDGTWYLKLYEKDGRPVNPNRLQPLGVAELLEEAFRRTGDAALAYAAIKIKNTPGYTPGGIYTGVLIGLVILGSWLLPYVFAVIARKDCSGKEAVRYAFYLSVKKIYFTLPLIILLWLCAAACVSRSALLLFVPAAYELAVSFVLEP